MGGGRGRGGEVVSLGFRRAEYLEVLDAWVGRDDIGNPFVLELAVSDRRLCLLIPTVIESHLFAHVQYRGLTGVVTLFLGR